jgi:hypothetical protein
VINESSIIIGFIVSAIVSTIIIYIVTKLFGEGGGIGRAFLAAVVGAVVYTIVDYIFGYGWIATIIAGLVWLVALQALYKIGWLKAFVTAVVIWIVAVVVSFFLPTLPGPA